MNPSSESEIYLKYINIFLQYLHVCLVALIVLVNLFTSLVYVFTWNQHSLAGKAFAQMLLSRAFHLIIYGVIGLVDNAGWPQKLPVGCLVIGFIHQMLWMSEYSWLLAVNYDFWQKFRSLASLQKRSVLDQTKRFWKYFLFAWGTPLVIVSCFLVADILFGSKAGILFSTFGSCYISWSSLIFYIIPVISIFVLASVFFSVLTQRAILHQRNESASARLAKNSSSDISSFQLFWKLSMLMGVNWIIEFILGLLFIGVFAESSEGNMPMDAKEHLMYLIGGLVLILYMLGSACAISFMFVVKNKTGMTLLNHKFSYICCVTTSDV
ncbi:unnamed protein product [Orchesella dallaii]|uniref:G-protein coupled receptors family 2 profile 2 domain-containing protein n=1 Tax=Orchesella dallaii TaxID=48710 RepID=A0ABP1RGN3_9HEXA